MKRALITGATGQLLTDLARHLAAQGHKVTLIVSRQRYDAPKADLAPRETVDGVRVVRVQTTRLDRHWLPARALDYATFYIAAFVTFVRLAQPGVVVLAKTGPPLLWAAASWAARWCGARLITWQQDLFPEVAAALGASWAADR